VKKAWLGVDYKQAGIAGNDMHRSNVPNTRIGYRYDVLCEELHLLKVAYHSRQEVILFHL
ncbi:unnamed protein product, partial [Rotaria sp. Silwood1]